MLIESLKDWQRYDFGPQWQEVMTWIMANPKLEPGAYAAGGCAINVFDGPSRPWGEPRYEYHRLMADVQVLLSGREYIYNVPRHDLTEHGEYDPVRDLGFYAERPAGSRVLFEPGMFAFLLPWDAHMPSMAIEDPVPVRKLVAKVPVAQLHLR